MIRSGDIGFAGKRSGWYPAAVRWFTNSRWSHCFVVMPQYLGDLAVLEADLKVQVVPFQKEYVEKNADYYEIWRPIKATESQVWRACQATYMKDAGAVYGFLQISWFAIRQLLRKIGLSLPGGNWFPDGEICSETLWQYLMNLGGEYRALVESLGEDECSPEDLWCAVKSRLDLFQFVSRRD